MLYLRKNYHLFCKVTQTLGLPPVAKAKDFESVEVTEVNQK